MSTAVVYRTAPNMEHKAAAELREAGIRAYVGRDRGAKRNPFTGKRRVVAPGYVFAAGACQRAFAKHVKGQLGKIDRAELGRLYIAKPKPAREQNPYGVGQKVLYGEVPAKVVDVRGRSCVIAWVMCGKQHSQAIHYAQLRPG